MKLTIWKYLLNGAEAEVDMPKGAKILCVKSQNDDLYVWALINSEEREVYRRRFCVYGTGQTIDNMKMARLHYIGTCLVLRDTFVWHVFEEV